MCTICKKLNLTGFLLLYTLTLILGLRTFCTPGEGEGLFLPARFRGRLMEEIYGKGLQAVIKYNVFFLFLFSRAHVCSKIIKQPYNQRITLPRRGYQNYRVCCRRSWGICTSRCTRTRFL